MSAETFRIGVGAGFAGDRLDPAEELAKRGELDAMAFECLAERTIGLAQQARRDGAGPGYDSRILRRLAGTLPHLLPRGATATTNAGAANPVAAAHATKGLLAELGLSGTVGAVTGDDVLGTIDLKGSRVLGTDDTLWDLRDRLVSANAYIGAEPIRRALDEGAEIVITGRCSDAALFLAPLARAFDWSGEDLDAMADGTLVGHLLECAGQLTGGYFADAGRKRVDELWNLGFPLADVLPDGSAVYSKLPGTGGLLDRRTVLEQLLYEIDDPAAYKTPDVTLDLSRVRIVELGDDRVRVDGARAAGRPDRLKVSVGVRDGCLGVAEISYAGPGCRGRAELAAEILRERWERIHGRDRDELVVSLIGVDSSRPWWHDGEKDPAEVRLRVSIRVLERSTATTLCEEVEALYTNGPYGGGGVVTSVRETVGIVSTLVEREAVTPEVVLL